MTSQYISELPMTPFQANATEFLSKFVISTTVPDASQGKPIMACAFWCNMAKADITHVNACNSFLYKDETCHLGYVEPIWVFENAYTGPDIIYSDVVIF